MSPEEVAERLNGRPSGDGWSARCPAHEDRSPSLSIAAGDKGGTVVHCHAGCEPSAVVAAVGLELRDLAPDTPSRDDAVATYRYTDENGRHLFDVVRRPGKRFHQRPADGRTGPGAMKDTRLVLYRLPAVRKAVAAGTSVFIVEGEKDADRLASEGWCATTSPQGAGKWAKVADHAREVLAGAEVVVVADRDGPGYKHATEVAESLRPVARSLIVVEALGGKDVSDHLDAGHAVEELVEVDGTEAPVPDPPPPVRLTDWAAAFARPPVEAVVDGLLFPGRWTGFVAPAKAGKSTLALHIAHRLARGLEPFSAGHRPPEAVLYLDGEMGEIDVVERLDAADLRPADLGLLAYSDLPPKGDTVQGGAAIVSTAHRLGASVVVLDGINAFVSGAEKDDGPWRALYEHTIGPLKRAGVAVLTSDNTGKDVTLSARGSSVKLDKADGVVLVKRTDDGVRLTTTHARTSSYVRELTLNVTGTDGTAPISFTVSPFAWPAGTLDAVALLDSLGVPATAGRPACLAALKVAGEGVRTEVLAAAIRWRKGSGTPPGTRLGNTSGEHP